LKVGLVLNVAGYETPNCAAASTLNS